MKKGLILLLSIILAGTLGITAFAQPAVNNRLEQQQQKPEQTQANLEQKQQKLDEIEARNSQKQQKLDEIEARNSQKQQILAQRCEQFAKFKESLFENRQKILEYRKEYIRLSKQIKKLRIEILEKFKKIRQNGLVLPDETAAQIKEYAAKICELAKSLRNETCAEVREIMKKYRNASAQKNYESMNAVFGEISGIHQSKLEKLKQIVELLQKINGLLTDFLNKN